MVEGQVYILVNKTIQGLVKVGKTKGESLDRAASLSSATGVASAFVVFKSYAVADCDAAENFAHRILEASVGRPNKSREFFNGPVETICSILDDALVPFLRRDAAPFLERFDNAFKRVANKEFTMACIEFEEILPNAVGSYPDPFFLGRDFVRILGTYLACCIQTARTPILSRFICHIRIKNDVMQSAIDTLRGWTTDPTQDVISFVRELC